VHTSLTVLTHVLVASSTGSSSSGKGSSFLPFLVLLALFGVAYFAFLRPARNRQRATVAQRRAADVGDEITTTAGLIATVVAVDDDEITLEVAPGVHCRYLPAAILRVNTEDTTEPDEAEADPSNHEVIDASPASYGEQAATPAEPFATEPTATEPAEPTQPSATTAEPFVTQQQDGFATQPDSTASTTPTESSVSPAEPIERIDGTTDNPGGTAPA
jgi:preprotein translocase subunit YajC